MKKITSIKTRITIWYTTLMFVLIAIVLSLVGTLSYRLSIDNVEKSVTLQVTQISERLANRQRNVLDHIDDNEEFKNVSLYSPDGKYIAGQYISGMSAVNFHEGRPRRVKADGKEYIVYDLMKRGAPGEGNGFWIRGAESVNSTMLLGRAAVAVALIVIPLILLLTALGGYYITKKAFQPINTMIRTANDIATQNDITRRIAISPDAKKDELYHLSVTLNRMLDRIENLIKQEKQFTSDASHELRTPISVILAQGEYLLEIAQRDKEKELAENIVTKAKQVSKLVARLLLLARIDQNRQKFNKEKVDLGVLADIAIDGLKEAAAEKDITLSCETAENLMAEADESLLLSVMTNLVANGIKYGKQGGYVRITAVRTERGTEIAVADNGIGIPAEHLDKIWGRFYRVDDVRNDEYGSCGLGLAMVKSIVTLHGGTIDVRSKPGAGSTFRIVLR